MCMYVCAHELVSVCVCVEEGVQTYKVRRQVLYGDHTLLFSINEEIQLKLKISPAYNLFESRRS